MKNYSLDINSGSESETDNIIFNNYGGYYQNITHSGGQNDNEMIVSDGGFPPIYLCDKNIKKNVENIEEKKERKYSSHTSTVTIKDIMKNRRGKTPFI